MSMPVIQRMMSEWLPGSLSWRSLEQLIFLHMRSQQEMGLQSLNGIVMRSLFNASERRGPLQSLLRPCVPSDTELRTARNKSWACARSCLQV